MGTQEQCSAQRWEELTTPEAVMAAFEAGQQVELTYFEGRNIWLKARPESKESLLSRFSMRVRYRALIEEAPPIPEGYTPWAGGECPEDAVASATHVYFRVGGTSSVPSYGHQLYWKHDGDFSDIIGYRVEPEQEEEPSSLDLIAIRVEAMANKYDSEGLRAIAADTRRLAIVSQAAESGSEYICRLLKDPKCDRCGARNALEAETMCKPSDDTCPGVEWPLERIWQLAAPQPIPVESLGLADDGVKALADARDIIYSVAIKVTGDQQASHDIADNAAGEVARRLRPTVDASTAERRARELLAAEYDRDGIPFVADCIRADAMLSGPETRAIRALTAALTTSPEAGNG